MTQQPAYVRIAGEIARRIRTGELPPRAQLPSRTELAEVHGVSDIVIRSAIGLLRSQGLVRTVERRGVFVAERPTLSRVSPERQLESAEMSFTNEAGDDVHVERQEHTIVPATDDIADALGVPHGTSIVHVTTRVAVDGKPISISETYEPTGTARGDAKAGRTLEETLAIQPPPEHHAAYLGIPAGDSTVTIRQRFATGDRVDMVTDITYPTDRYASFVFRMQLPAETKA